jgi:hypothetical protein
MKQGKILAWINGWCPRDTLVPNYINPYESRRRVHRIRWLAFNGLGLTLLTVSLLIAPTFESGFETVFQMDTLEPSLYSSHESVVTYRIGLISKFMTTYGVKIRYRYEFDMDGGRTTKLVYRVYSNGVHIGDIDDTYEIGSGGGGGDYGLMTIPLETLMMGENTVQILIDCNSETTTPRTRTDALKYTIDSAVVTDNFRLTFLVVLLFVPINLFLGGRGTRGVGAV